MAPLLNGTRLNVVVGERAYVRPDASDRLGNIRAHTLFVTGERDRLTPPCFGRELAEAVPGAEFHLVAGPGASHLLPLERPADFNNIILSFLKAWSQDLSNTNGT